MKLSLDNHLLRLKLLLLGFLVCSHDYNVSKSFAFSLKKRSNNTKEYLSMTKYLVFEVGFSEKRNKI